MNACHLLMIEIHPITLSGTVVFPEMSGLHPREDDAKFFESSRRAEGSPPRAKSRSKTFPEGPIMFRVSCGNPESRQGIVLGLGIVKGSLGTWVAPELLAVSGS